MTAGNANDDFDDELLSAYVDGELTATERALVEERLRSDSTAAAFVNELRSLSSAIKSLPRQTLGRDLRAGVLAEVEQTRADLAQHGPAAERDAATLPPADRRAGLRRGLFWSALAIAATVLVALFQPTEIAPKERELARAEKQATGEKAKADRAAPVKLEEQRSQLSDESAVGTTAESVDAFAQTNGVPTGEPLPLGFRGSMNPAGVEGAESKSLAAEPMTGLAVQSAQAPMPAPAAISDPEAHVAAADALPKIDGDAAADSLNLQSRDLEQPGEAGATLSESLERSAPMAMSRSAMPPAGVGQPADAPASATAAFGGVGGGAAGPRGGAALDAAAPTIAAAKPAAKGLADAPTAREVRLKLATADGAQRFRKLLAESQISPGAEPGRAQKRYGREMSKLEAAESVDQLADDKERGDIDAAAGSFYFFSELDQPAIDPDGSGGEQELSQAGQPMASGEQRVWVEASPAEIDALLEKCRAAEATFAAVELNDPLAAASAKAKLGAPLRAQDEKEPESLRYVAPLRGYEANAARERVLFVLEPFTPPELAAPAAEAPATIDAK